MELIYTYGGFMSNRIKINIFVLLFSLLLAIILNNKYNITYKSDYLNIKNGSSDLIISELVVDNEKIILNDNYNEVNDYNIYSKNGGKYFKKIAPFTEEKINIKNKKSIKISFMETNKEKFIFINGKYFEVPSNNYNYGSKAYTIKVPSYTYTLDNTINNTTLSFISIGFILSFIVSKLIISKFNTFTLIPLFLINLYPFIEMSILYKVLFVLGSTLLINLKGKIDLNIKNKILIYLSSFIISFTMIGGYILEVFNIEIIASFLLLLILNKKIINYIIYLIDKYRLKERKSPSKKELFIHKIILMIIIIIICLIYQNIFYPYIITPDGHMQIEEMMANNISNWHPYSHTLLMYIFYLFFGNFKLFIILRIIIFSIFLSNIFIYLVHRGLSIKKMYIYTILFVLFPVTGVYLISIVKDVDFSICFLYLSYLFYLIFNDYNYFRKNKFNYLYLILTILGVGLFRHNSFYVAIIIIFILTIYSYIKSKKYLFLSVLISLTLMYSFLGPVYKELKIIPYPENIKSAFMLHGFNKLIIEDKKSIDKDFYNYLLDKVPLIEWGNIYDKYDIDLMLHYSNSYIRNMSIDNKLLFDNYLNQLFKTPIPILKDRLYGSNLVWQLTDIDVDVYKYTILYDMFSTNYGETIGIKYKEGNIYKLINKTLIVIADNEILNLLFFRGGFYFIILNIVLLYFLIEKEHMRLLTLAPIILNSITLFISLHHQEYRYVWYMELVGLLFLLLMIYGRNNSKSKIELDKEEGYI